MALSGDIFGEVQQKRASIRLETDIRVSPSGLVSEDWSDQLVTGVTQVVEGDIDQVLHLIGYGVLDLDELTSDGILSASDEVNEKLKLLGPRSPSSHLLVHNNRLYGVVVDHQNQSRVLGLIDCVIPNKQINSDFNTNTLVIGRDGVWKTMRSKDFNLDNLVDSGVVFGIVSEHGFAFFESGKPSEEEMSKLVLVLNKGYFVIEDTKVNWTRLQVGLRIDEFKTKTTTLAPKECIVCLRGGYLRTGDRLEVFGSQNAVVDYDSLHNMMKAMRTVGFAKDNTTQPKVEVNPDVPQEMAEDLKSNQ